MHDLRDDHKVRWRLRIHHPRAHHKPLIRASRTANIFSVCWQQCKHRTHARAHSHTRLNTTMLCVRVRVHLCAARVLRRHCTINQSTNPYYLFAPPLLPNYARANSHLYAQPRSAQRIKLARPPTAAIGVVVVDVVSVSVCVRVCAG